MLDEMTQKELYDVSKSFAKRQMLESGSIDTHFVVVTSGGLRFIFTPWRNEEDKSKMLTVLRLAFVLWRVKFYAMVSEVWIATYKNDPRKDPLKIMPSEHPDRVEAVHVICVGEEEVLNWTSKIIRDKDEKVVDLKNLYENDQKLEGRMVSLLPPKEVNMQPSLEPGIELLVQEGLRRYNMTLVDMEEIPTL
jgi:hypothetical protein